MVHDYIIVGFGLAGLAIAQELEQREKIFKVVDRNTSNASCVAGGVSNPVILKRFTKAWKADKFIPKAEQFYRSIDKQLSIQSYKKTPVYRRIKSAGEQNDWFIASDRPNLKPFMDEQLKTLNSPIEAPFKFGKVQQTSLLNTDFLIKKYCEQLKIKGLFIKEKFNHDKIVFQNNYISYGRLKTRKIVFCEGYGLLNNPFFNNLPLIGNKGEYLIIKAPDINLKVILKTALALIPLGNDYYKFGATYSRDFKDVYPEQQAQDFLIKKLDEIIKNQYTVVNTEVGIRPTVLDRKPLLGKHPEFQNLLICNGFGSHGVMMAPTTANWLLDYDIKNKPLPKAVNVKRYFDA